MDFCKELEAKKKLWNQKSVFIFFLHHWDVVHQKIQKVLKTNFQVGKKLESHNRARISAKWTFCNKLQVKKNWNQNISFLHHWDVVHQKIQKILKKHQVGKKLESHNRARISAKWTFCKKLQVKKKIGTEKCFLFFSYITEMLFIRKYKRFWKKNSSWKKIAKSQ